MATDAHALTKVDGGAIAKPLKTIRDLLQSDQFKSQVAAALPRHMKADRMIRVALTALLRTPGLTKCTQDSFFKCVLDCSAMGIEPDGRRAHLIPYGNVCTLVVDYKGLAELVRRSGDVSYIHADVVYEGDEWSYSFGSKSHLRHIPKFEARTSKIKAVYSFVRLKDGCEDFAVMSEAEVNEIRQKYSKQPNGDPWKLRWPEMAKKTVFRNHSKWLPLSADVRDAIERDDVIVEPNVEHALISLDSLTPSDDENRGHDATAPASNLKITAEDLKKAAPAPPMHIEDQDEFPETPEDLWIKVRGQLYHRKHDGSYEPWEREVPVGAV